MKNRTEPTLVEKAIIAVPGFEAVYKKLSAQVTSSWAKQKHPEQLH